MICIFFSNYAKLYTLFLSYAQDYRNGYRVSFRYGSEDVGHSIHRFSLLIRNNLKTMLEIERYIGYLYFDSFSFYY